MKVKPISVRFNQQHGFSLLEALLSIVIILAAGLGVVELFISADKKNKAQAVQQIVQQAGSAMSQLLSTSYNNTGLSTADVVKSGLISNTYVNPSDSTVLVGPYGTITVQQVPDSASEYYVTVNTVPGEQAVNICQNMFTSAAVYLGSAVPSTTGNATSVATCQAIFGSGGSSAKQTMSFAFPREDYISNA